MPPIGKKDLNGRGLAHPAPYTRSIVELFGTLELSGRVLDPFAGTGLIHDLGLEAVGVEIEPEWAELREGTIIGDATRLPFRDVCFDAVVTSCTYGNRYADHHKAKDGSLRRTYTHDLGRDLHPRNTGKMAWKGPGVGPYCELHEEAWSEVWRVLARDGRFVLNIKNHIKAGVEQMVTEWHAELLSTIGFNMVQAHQVFTPGMRVGANRQRVPFESVLVWRKP